MKATVENTNFKVNGYLFEGYEAKVLSSTLLHHGHRVRLQRLPFRLLLVLLEEPGRVFTHGELQKRLWGEDISADYGAGLWTAMAKLREALRDDPSKPRFIETVAREGYRFIAQVTPVASDTPAIVPLPAQTAPEQESLPRLAAVVETIRSPGLVTGKNLALLSVAAALAITGVLVFRNEKTPVIDDQTQVVLGGFVNRTGDGSFDKTLSLAFQVKMEESPYLSVIPDRRFRQIIKDPSSANLQDELHACVSLGGKVILTGEIQTRRSGYAVMLKAWRCDSGRLLTTQESRAGSKDVVLPALDLAGEQLRRRLGESDVSLRKFNVPLKDSTTSSLAASRAFTQGEDRRFNGSESQAIADYTLAIDLDPKFAFAYARLGTIYLNAGEQARGRQYYQKAFDLRERATDRERLDIVSHYYSAIGEIQYSIDAYELWHSLYPHDDVPVNNLASWYLTLGKPDLALPLARTALEMNPSAPMRYATLAMADLMDGRTSDLQALCHDPVHGRSDVGMFHIACFDEAVLQRDDASMQQQLQWAHENPEGTVLLKSYAIVKFDEGQVSEARRLFAEVIQMAMGNHLTELAAEMSLGEAELEIDFGFPREAKEDVFKGLQLDSTSTHVRAFAALMLARLGDTERAESEASSMAAESPSDTILNTVVVASVRAAIQLNKGDPNGAIRSLEAVRPLDFCLAMSLAPAYFRGMAYLQAGRPEDASKEFGRVIDNRAISPESPYIVLSQMELGRSRQLMGKPAEAMKAFKYVESVWKDADADFPLIKQIRMHEHELELASSPARVH